MQLFAISGLINSIVSVGLGALVMVRDARSKLNRLFFLMTAALGVWGFGYWMWLSVSERDSAMLWVRVFSVGSLFIPLFYFHWVLVLINQEDRHKGIVRTAYALATFFSFFISSPLFIRGVQPKLFFPFWPVPGLLYTMYILSIYLGLVGYALFLLYKAYPTAKETTRGQIFYVVLGTVIGFGGGLTNFFLWYGIPVPPYGNFLVAIFPFLLGYSTFKHGLFNIKTIATELFIFSLWIFILVRTLIATEIQDQIANGILLFLTIVVGTFLVRSVYREVAQREKIEKLAGELEIANERLKGLDQQKSEFVSIASHQLRSPLTAIKGYSSMILEGSFGRITPQTHDAIERIFQSSQSLVVVIENFLNISRIEQGRMRYEMLPTVLTTLTKEVVGQLLPNAQKKGLTLSVTVQPPHALDTELTVQADTEKIRQVILNLVDNAIKYTASGSIGVALERHEPDKHPRITVTDTGVGMSPLTLQKLFQKFSRADGASKVNATGSGLGLFLAAEIMKAHNGFIRAESDGPGKGSRFIIEFGG